MQQHQTTPPTKLVPPQPPPADPPRVGTAPDAPVNLKYLTKRWKPHTTGTTATPFHSATHHPKQKGNVLPTSWAPPPPTPAGPPTVNVTSDASVNLKYSTLAYVQTGWDNLNIGNDATPLSSSYSFQKPDEDLPLIIWAPPPHIPAGPPKSGPKPDPPVNLKRPTLAYDQIGRWTFTTGVCITPLPTIIHSLLSPKSDFLPTAPRIPHPIFLAVYSNAAQAAVL
eukprot:scaffold672_cov185-Isochrysis_galbana.AAC.1